MTQALMRFDARVTIAASVHPTFPIKDLVAYRALELVTR